MLFSLLFNETYIPFETKVIIFLTFTFAVIIALTSHEFAHAFTAYKLGDQTPKAAGRLTLNPMAHFDKIGLISFLFLGFGWAKPVPINAFNFKKIKRDTLLVSLSGVFVNFILAFISYPLFLLSCKIQSTSVFAQILTYFTLYLFQTNLILMVFNLLPIYPLDGFNAISSQLKYTNPFVNFMYKYGRIVLIVALIIFAYTNIFDVLVYYISYPISKFWNLIFFGV